MTKLILWAMVLVLLSQYSFELRGEANVEARIEDGGLELAEVLAYPNNARSLDALTRSKETLNKGILLHLGKNSKRERIKLIQNAREYIFITVPYWFGDEDGQEIYREMKAAKDKNPKLDIKILEDWTSPASTSDFFASKMYRQLKKLAGEENVIQWNKLWNMRDFSFAILKRRIHDKVFVVDGKYLIMGGMNIGNDYLQGGSTKLGWHDTDILFEGPVAQQAAKIFLKPFLLQSYFDKTKSPFPTTDRLQLMALQYYYYFDQPRITYYQPTLFSRKEKVIDLPLKKYLDDPRYFPPLELDNPEYTTPVRLIYDSPFVDRQMVPVKGTKNSYEAVQFSKLLNTLEFILPNVKKSMRLFIPYLTLSDRMIGILTKAAKRVKVEIITNSLKSHDLGTFNYYAALPVIKKLTEAGIDVYEWQGHKDLIELEKNFHCEISDYWPGRTIHTKAIVLDRSVLFLGSHNLNVRSEKHNSEIMALIRDPKIAREMDDIFQYDLDMNEVDVAQSELKCGNKYLVGRPRRVQKIEMDFLNKTIKGLKFKIFPKLYDFM